LCLCIVLLLGALPTVAWGLSLSEKVGLQAAMQRYIDRQMVEGVFLYLEVESGEVRVLHPVTAHSMVLRMGQHYVLCFDFRDDQGNDVNVDFFLARRDTSYVVFHTTIDDRKLLKRMMGSGRISRAE
jgi:hypothetical protein